MEEREYERIADELEAKAREEATKAQQISPEQEMENLRGLIKSTSIIPKNIRAAILEICESREIDKKRLEALVEAIGGNESIFVLLAATNLVLWLAEHRGTNERRSGRPALCFTWENLDLACSTTRILTWNIEQRNRVPCQSTFVDLLGNRVASDIDPVSSVKIRSRHDIGKAILDGDITRSGQMPPESLSMTMLRRDLTATRYYQGIDGVPADPNLFGRQLQDLMLQADDEWRHLVGRRSIARILFTDHPVRVGRIILFGLRDAYSINDETVHGGLGQLDNRQMFKLNLIRDLVGIVNANPQLRVDNLTSVAPIICWPAAGISVIQHGIIKSTFGGYNKEKWYRATEDESWTWDNGMDEATRKCLRNTVIVSLSPHFPVRQMIADLSRDGEEPNYPAAIICKTINDTDTSCEDASCKCEIEDVGSGDPFCYCECSHCRDPVTPEVVELGKQYDEICAFSLDPAYTEIRNAFGSVSVYCSRQFGPTARNLTL